MKQTVYYNALRGPLAVKPIELKLDRVKGNSINTGPCVVCKVTARNTHSGYKTGEIINCELYSIVRILSGQRCYSVGIAEIKRIIERSTQP